MQKILFIIFLELPFILFAQNGNVGINTANPKQKLHVKGSFRFEPVVSASNPVAAADKVLVSDAYGNATWGTPVLVAKNYYATFGTTQYNFDNYASASDFNGRQSGAKYTGTSITLPKGKWLVIVNLFANVKYSSTPSGTFGAMPANRGIWVRTTLADDTTQSGKGNNLTTMSADIIGPSLVSNAVVGPSSNVLVNGELIINTTATSKTYYLMVEYSVDGFQSSPETARLINFGLAPNTTTGENLPNKIIAYPIK